MWLTMGGGALFGIGVALFAGFYGQFPTASPSYGSLEAGYVVVGVGIILMSLGLGFIQMMRMNRARQEREQAAMAAAPPPPQYLPPSA
jgi:formate hydrogenlyase subunit 3/multisubunit Na+/H+ antiporter MnhD subunit